MKKYNIQAYLFGISLIISIVILAYNFVTTYQYNQNLKNTFVQTNFSNVYAKQEELTKNSLLMLPPYHINIASNAIEKEKLGITLCYYKKPGDWIPAKIILKGTKVIVNVGSDYHSNVYEEIRDRYTAIYGFSFHPSYQKGWRVVLPLITEQEYSQSTESEPELLYVRTSDVKKLEKAYRKQGLIREKDWYLSIDKTLYEMGYYLSPDLYRSYFSFPVKCVISVWILVIMFRIVQRKWRKLFSVNTQRKSFSSFV